MEPAEQAREAERDLPTAGELDLGLEEVERENDLATLARVEAELGEVEKAMRRIEEGSYGLCEVCGSPIEAELLEPRPTARLCEVHQQAPGA